MLQVSRDGTLFKRMSKLANLVYQGKRGPSVQRYSIEEKGKVQVHLIELMNEGQEKALMGLERSLKIPNDVMDVMAQTK